MDYGVKGHSLGHTDYAVIPIPLTLEDRFVVSDKSADSFGLQVSSINYTYDRFFTCIIIEHPTTVNAVISTGTDTVTVSHSLGHTDYQVIPESLTIYDAFVVTDRTASAFTLTVNSIDFTDDRTVSCVILEHPVTYSAVIDAEATTATVTEAFDTIDYNIIPVPQSLEDQFTTLRSETDFVLTTSTIDYSNPRTFSCIYLFGGEYMSTCQEGLNASLSVNGTVIALLSEVTFEHDRTVKEWVSMGSVATDDVLLGANKYKVTAKHGYVDNTYLNYIQGGSVLAGTLFPRGGTTPTVAGSLICTNSKLSGMQQESADPVMEDLTFTFFKVTHA
jgi:hypothetical protein